MTSRRHTMRPLYRRTVNRLALTLATLAAASGLFWLAWILFEVLRLGAGGLTLALVTQMTPPPGEAGGLANAIVGSTLMVGLASVIGTPIGVLAGVYLAEVGSHGNWLARALARGLRVAADVLSSAPSILIGLFVYTIAVAPRQGFSGWAGALALALIVIPVVIRSSEAMLALIPASLREAAHALGASRAVVIVQVLFPAARAGVTTGVLLAVARIAGETAPLLFTALNHQFFSLDLSGPMASLPVVIFKFAMSPYPNWQQLAWAGVLLITLAVLALTVLARWLTRGQNQNT